VLQIVDDQHFGGAQLFLEGQRVLAIERAQEVAHEIFGTQEQGALAALAEFQRRGVQKMRLAEAETAMDVEQRNVGLLAIGKGARCAMAKLIGDAGNEAFKGLLGMQHPVPKTPVILIGAAFAAWRQIRNAGGCIGKTLVLGLARNGAADHGARIAGGHGGNHDRQRGGREAFGHEGFFDAADIMIGHPVAYEGLGRADLQIVGFEGFQIQRPDPGVEYRIAELTPHAFTHRRPGRAPVRHGFSCLHHLITRFVWPSLEPFLLLRHVFVSAVRQPCRQGSPDAFQPFKCPRWPSPSTSPSKPPATLKACS
jgi:hypothetical protein